MRQRDFNKTKSCPNCGSPTFFVEEENNENWKSIGFIILIIGGVIFILNSINFMEVISPYSSVSKPYLGIIECPMKKKN